MKAGPLVHSMAMMPLPLRRQVLRAHWRSEIAMRRSFGYGLTDILQRSLRVPRREAQALDREIVFHDRLQDLEWYCAAVRRIAQLEADDRHVRVDSPDLIARLAEEGRPVVLAPLHMGVFSLAVMHLAHHYFRGRRILILRAREDHETDSAAMRRLKEIASEFRFLNVKDRSEFAPAMRFAREGALVICFLDLPAAYGNPADITLFGRPARIALGVDAISRMLEAVVVPMAVRSGLDGDEVLTGEPFEVADGSKAERNAVAARIARCMQRFVHHDPAQWHMWGRLHEFEVEADARGAGVNAVA